MNAHRDRGGQIWITEIGWGDRGPKHRFIVGEKGQAERIAKSFALIRKQRTKLRLRGVVYFSWRDGAPYAPDFRDLWGLHTGLLDINGNPKAGFGAFGSSRRLSASRPIVAGPWWFAGPLPCWRSLRALSSPSCWPRRPTPGCRGGSSASPPTTCSPAMTTTARPI